MPRIQAEQMQQRGNVVAMRAQREDAIAVLIRQIEQRSLADTLLIQLKLLDIRNAWIKHCQTCEICNPLLRL